MFIIEKEEGIYLSIDGRNAKTFKRCKLFQTEQDAIDFVTQPELSSKVYVSPEHQKSNYVFGWKVRELEILYRLK